MYCPVLQLDMNMTLSILGLHTIVLKQKIGVNAQDCDSTKIPVHFVPGTNLLLYLSPNRKSLSFVAGQNGLVRGRNVLQFPLVIAM